MSFWVYTAVLVVGGAFSFVVALLLGRRWLLLLPLAGWPLFYLGLNESWWGSGLGEGGEIIAALVTVGGIALVGLGLLLHRVRSRSSSSLQ